MRWSPSKSRGEIRSCVIAEDGHQNAIYELSGKLMTQEELAAEVAAVSGRDIPVLQVDDAAYGEMIKNAGVPEPMVAMLVAIQRAIREGALAIESDDFEKLLGRPLTPIREALREITQQL